MSPNKVGALVCPGNFTVAARRVRRYAWINVFCCALTCVVGSAYVARDLNKGWIPFDDGTLAHIAQRVLAGDVPHRDFDEPYTGGLTYANAFAFRVLGTNLGTLRLVLFAFTVPWIAAMFYVASRFGSPLTACTLTLLALAWGVPNYPAAMPSWYNLFFATFGCAAVFRYVEVGKRRWLFVAGIWGGLSVLVKIIGFYYLIALVVFAAYWEQSSAVPPRSPTAKKFSPYSLFLATGGVCLTVAIYSLIHRRPGLPEALHFILPPVIMVAIVLQREWVRREFASRERFERLGRFTLPIASGALLPLLVFVAPYVLRHAVGELYRGIFVMPLLRLDLAAQRPLGLKTFLPAVVLAIFVGILTFRQRQTSRTSALIIWILALVLLYQSRIESSWTELKHTFSFVLFSAQNIIPLATLLSVPLLLKGSSRGQQQLMLLCSLSAFCGLVQFPYTNAVYFCYVAPLAVLMIGSLLSVAKRPTWQLSSAALTLYGLFAVLFLTPRLRVDNTHLASVKPVRMNIERAGKIEVDPVQGSSYETLVQLLREHYRGGAIYVTPSSPEVYFLAGMGSPTRTIIDAFDWSDQRVSSISNQLQTTGVNVVVINTAGEYPGRGAPLLEARLRSDFPKSAKSGTFEVRWKE